MGRSPARVSQLDPSGSSRRAQGARDEKTHDDLMAQAAFLTLGDRDFERALSLAAKIKDRAIRSEMQDLINFTAAVRADVR